MGAVVLTLNATGSELGLCRRKTWLTSWVKGPAWWCWLAMSRERAVRMFHTSEAELRWVEVLWVKTLVSFQLSFEPGFVIGALTTDIAAMERRWEVTGRDGRAQQRAVEQRRASAVVSATRLSGWVDDKEEG